MAVELSRGPTWAELADRWRGRRIVQVISDLSFGDAATGDTVAWQRILHGHGFDTPIYARHLEGPHGGQAWLLNRYEPREDDIVLLRYTVWSEAAAMVRELNRPFTLIYHNVTPPAFFSLFEPSMARETRRGREELASLAPLSVVALANSEYSRQDLLEAGFRRTGILPILLDWSDLDGPVDRGLHARLSDGRTNLLVVGRIAPNKRIEDDIVVFAHYAKIDPTARLLLVGHYDGSGRYLQLLQALIGRLGLTQQVVFTGKVSRRALVTYYRAAHVYLTMSEHEGFCVPLVEAMAAGVPIVARDATAIPDTAGDAAIFVRERRFDVVAELLHLVRSDRALRERLIWLGRRRLEEFGAERTEARLAAELGDALEGAAAPVAR